MIEKVNPMHPDKIADRIAGALLDMVYAQDEKHRAAVEVLIGHGKCHIINETTAELNKVDIYDAVCRITGRSDIEVFYDEYRQDSILAGNQARKIRCGDNGIFRGAPLTAEQKFLSMIARQLYKAFPTDGKYILDGDRLIVCQSCASNEDILYELSPFKAFYPTLKIEVNPLGYWTGGIDVDTGATNRKLGSDMAGSITGGGLHGKDLSNRCTRSSPSQAQKDVKKEPTKRLHLHTRQKRKRASFDGKRLTQQLQRYVLRERTLPSLQERQGGVDRRVHQRLRQEERQDLQGRKERLIWNRKRSGQTCSKKACA